jgi:hypothetical protein
MTNFFSVYEWIDGRHDGYVLQTSASIPWLSANAVGYMGQPSFREALESVKAHRATACDGHCEPFLAKRTMQLRRVKV